MDPYEILGVERGAPDGEIGRAHRRLSKKYHPDALPPGATAEDRLEAEERLKRINAARDELLTDRERQVEREPDDPPSASNVVSRPDSPETWSTVERLIDMAWSETDAVVRLARSTPVTSEALDNVVGDAKPVTMALPPDLNERLYAGLRHACDRAGRRCAARALLRGGFAAVSLLVAILWAPTWTDSSLIDGLAVGKPGAGVPQFLLRGALFALCATALVVYVRWSSRRAMRKLFETRVERPVRRGGMTASVAIALFVASMALPGPAGAPLFDWWCAKTPTSGACKASSRIAGSFAEARRTAAAFVERLSSQDPAARTSGSPAPRVSDARRRGAPPTGAANWNGAGTALHDAASSGVASNVLALVQAGANPRSRDESGRTPLHDAARNNEDPAIVRMLVEAGADPNARDANGRIPLHDSGLNGNPLVAARLVMAGAYPNARDENGRTPLHDASFNRNPLIAAALIASGADPNIRDRNGRTPLHEAARTNPNAFVAETLLDAGANPRAVDLQGRTPGDYARGNRAFRDTNALRRLNGMRR